MSTTQRFTVSKVPFSFSDEYQLCEEAPEAKVSVESLQAVHSLAARRRLELMRQNQRRGELFLSLEGGESHEAEDDEDSNRSAMSPSLHAALRRKMQQKQQPEQQPQLQQQAQPRQQRSSSQSRPRPVRQASYYRQTSGSLGSDDKDDHFAEDCNVAGTKPPKELLRIASQCLQCGDDDWESKRRGLNLVRILARSHPGFLQGEYRTVLPLMLAVAKNLRTQVSRVAIRAVGELLDSLGRAMEPDVDRIVEQLLVRFADTNKFIQAELENCFGNFASRVRADLAIPALIRIGAKHKSINVRAHTAQILIQSLQNQSKVSKISPATIEMARNFAMAATQDADPSVRQFGRDILRIL